MSQMSKIRDCTSAYGQASVALLLLTPLIVVMPWCLLSLTAVLDNCFLNDFPWLTKKIVPLVRLCHTAFCHREAMSFAGREGEHLRIALISVNWPTTYHRCYSDSLGKPLHPHPLLMMRSCGLVQRKEESVICHLQSMGVQKRKWHDYDPAIPSHAQHRSQQAFLIKWIISDTLRSFMESEKIYTGAVIKAEMYCHWQVNLLWYLRWCLFGNGPQHKHISRDRCCSLPTCAFWNMPLLEEIEWRGKCLWFFVIPTVTNVGKSFNSFSQ